MSERRGPYSRLRTARSKARQVLRRCWGDDVPVDVWIIAERLGIEVREEHFAKRDAVSACLILREEGAVIGVNDTHHENRQKFSIAHEIGHYSLHRMESIHLDYFRNERSSKAVDPREIEANAFAAELIMPETALRDRLGDAGVHGLDEEHVDDLAQEFEVSALAMTWRLTNLGYLR